MTRAGIGKTSPCYDNDYRLHKDREGGSNYARCAGVEEQLRALCIRADGQRPKRSRAA